mgnify:CR=1 FL=1
MNFEDEWIKYSKMDLAVAKRELYVDDDENAILTPIICFHAQQAVEKILKAFLVKNNIEFNKIHNLETLRKLSSTVDNEFNNIDFGNLNYYGVATRYPDGIMEMPSVKVTKELYEKAKEIVDFTLKKMNK